MNYSKTILSFLAFLIFSLLFVTSEVHGAKLLNFQESVEQCTEVNTLTTIINITDSTDFDFLVDEDYLIIANENIASQSVAD